MSDAAPQRPDHGGPAALSADDIVAATGGTLLARSDRPVRRGAVDSRAVEPGCLFVALPGTRVDGHDFVAEAIAAGAAAVLIGRTLDERAAAAVAAAPGGVTVVRVDDPLAGLQRIAAAWRARFAPLVVGVTGSVGKTSVKEAVAAVLASRLRTLKSPGNANNEIGLPLALLRLDGSVEAAVLEMGMYTGGEIADLARIGRPSIGIVTAVAPVHLERAGSVEAIAAAKAELVEALPPDGTAILNADDPVVRAFDRRTAARVVRYGTAPDADVRAEDVRAAGAAGTAFMLVASGQRREVVTPALGRHSALNGAAAAAAGLAAGLTIDAIAGALAQGWSAEHRAQLLDLGRYRLLDDTYNAAPPSMLAALELLSTLPGRPVAVLGEMLELGDLSDAGHRAVGEAAGRAVDELVTVGPGADRIADAAVGAGLAAGRAHRVADRAAAAAVLRGIVRDGDVVLVKASRGAALDLLVAELRAAEESPR
ncbi:MAG: UDP-N-acetylmuramoyl-tripeptide--D-alanyl-D-alanine ligase [Chloroflexi bacterium]|nr:UDP-N-acetylmuramoyl-tripeptide--D-alanyl-D-alanine ligase [Chloroflexota bacterium]